jgi:hypothetical protein
MPIDNSILGGIKSPEIDFGDPMADYNNYLLASTRMTGLRKEKREQDEVNALRGFYREATGADGKTNFDDLRARVAKGGYGNVIPGLLKDEGERAETAAKTQRELAGVGHLNAQTQETAAKAFEQAMTNARTRMANFSHDPKVGVPQMTNWLKEQFADPTIGPVLRARGATPESMVAEMNETLKKVPFEQYLLQQGIGMKDASEQNVTSMDYGDRKELVATNKHGLGGAVTPTTISSQRMGIDPGAVAKARASAPNISVNVQNIAAKGDTAYTQEANKILAGDDAKLREAADSAPDLIRGADEALKILKGGKVITGFGAGPRLTGEKVLNALSGGRLGNAELIRNTEIVGSKLANTTLAHIKASGLAGSAGLTEGERGFLEDGDEVTLTAHAGEGTARIGFGRCTGEIRAART